MTLFKYSLLILLLACSVAHSAKVQKWVDSDGKVHYGERPPEHATSQTLKGNISSIKNSNQSQGATLYSTSWCGYCKKAKAFMQANSISFAEVDIEKDSVAKRQYELLGGTAVPLLVRGKETLQGFNPASYKRFFNTR